MITLLCSKAKVTYVLPGQFAITQLSSAINKILLIIETESHSFKLYSQQSALLAANNSMPSRVTSYQCYQTGIRYHVNNQFFPIRANMAKKYKSLNFSGFNRRISKNFIFVKSLHQLCMIFVGIRNGSCFYVLDLNIHTVSWYSQSSFKPKKPMIS